jgi:hypothetical protein
VVHVTGVDSDAQPESMFGPTLVVSSEQRNQHRDKSAEQDRLRDLIDGMDKHENPVSPVNKGVAMPIGDPAAPQSVLDQLVHRMSEPRPSGIGTGGGAHDVRHDDGPLDRSDG